MQPKKARYLAAALLAGGVSVYATLFARQTHDTFDLPTWIDLTEWPATLLYVTAAATAWARLERVAALAGVAAMLAFLAAQSAHLFTVPLGFASVIAASLAFLLILPTTWRPR